MKNILYISISIIIISFFIGCSESSDSNNSLALFSSTAITSESTVENAKKVRAVVAKDQRSVIDNINTIIKENLNLSGYLNSKFSLSELCNSGGSLESSSSETESSIDFKNCSESGIVINGKILGVVSDYDETYDGYTKTHITFTSDLNISDQEYSLKIISGSSLEIKFTDITGNDYAQKMKMTINLLTEQNGAKYGQENAVYYFDYTSGYETMYQTSGRIYINNLDSYVDYDSSYDMSQTPFIFNNNGLDSGEARYIMENNTSLKIIAENGLAIIYIDTDDDGIYELRE